MASKKKVSKTPPKPPWELTHKQYLRSKVWKAKCCEAYEFYGKACFFCNRDKYLQVHHRRYRTDSDEMIYGREEMRDLSVMCRVCHRALHKKFFIKEGALIAKKSRRWMKKKTKKK